MMFHSQKGDKYIEEVIRPFLPSARLSSYVTLGMDSDLNLELDLYSLLENSQFQRNLIGDDYFIHFTSLTNLFHILRSKSLWMKDLNSMKDEKEFVFANSHLDHCESGTLKSKLLSLSLCEFSDQTVKNDSMWQEYGDNHRGVCIKLSLNTTRGIPPSYQLGNIAYCSENEPIKELEDLKNRHDLFKKKHGFSISNISEILFVISSMYKREQYKYECEIRLIKATTGNSIPLRNSSTEPPLEYSYNTKKKDFEYYLELPLNRPNESLIAPHISIEEIIIGKNIEDTELYYLREIIAEKYQSNFNKEVKISILKD
jgi:hypothetical protein